MPSPEIEIKVRIIFSRLLLLNNFAVNLSSERLSEKLRWSQNVNCVTLIFNARYGYYLTMSMLVTRLV
jgi:hypothetical protein